MFSRRNISEMMKLNIFRFGNDVQNFEVKVSAGGHYFVAVIKFDSLNQLVEYYKNISINRNDQRILLKDI